MYGVMQLLNSLGFSNGPLSSGGANMKSTHHFRDQLTVISGWFDQWNDCEQTVALYSLIKKLGPTHARFLWMVLEQNFTQCMELHIQEQEANDPVFISSLSGESKETAVNQLLLHLPLLRPGNDEAKSQYLGLIPKILAHSIRHGVHIEESRQLLSYSLIHPAISNEDRCSLTLWLRQLEDRIHNCTVYPPVTAYSNGVSVNATNGSLQPSTTVENYNGCQFNNLVPRLDMWRQGNLGYNGNSPVDVNSYSVLNGLGSNSLPSGVGSQHMALHGMNSAPSTGISSHPDGTQTLPMTHSRVKRSSSLTPPGSLVNHNSRLASTPSDSLEQDTLLHDGSVNPSSDHAPLSPQSSVTSSGSGSESQKDEKDAFSQDGTGMKDVPCWLKGLRLHKYSYIFKNMSYEEMMTITEEKLEKMNITKGARHKIVLSIQKLRERQSNLRSIEKDLQDGQGTIRSALNEIKSMIQTPIKAFNPVASNGSTSEMSNSGESESSGSDPPSSPPSPIMNDSDGFSQIFEGDLPGQITRLLGKICSSLLISSNQEENMNFFVMIVDKCLGHEAFTPVQKRRLFSWKQQIQKARHPLPPRRSLDNRQKNKWNSYHNGNAQNLDHETLMGPTSLRRRMPVQFQQPPQRMPLSRQNLSGNFSHTNQRSPLSAVIKRPSLQDHMKPHVQIQRTNSAPVRPNPLPASMFGKSVDGTADSNDPEINIRLESLCLSVTEHALGTYDGTVPLF